MKETIISIAKWHEETFPDATLDGQIEKYNEEYDEFYEANTEENMISELADMFIVVCGIARFSAMDGLFYFHEVDHELGKSNISFEQLSNAIDKKMETNRKRVWAKTAEGTYHHTNKEFKK